ncbi:MAG: class I SAM-dependent methyltransferase [Isosphaeraceae bacterium]
MIGNRRGPRAIGAALIASAIVLAVPLRFDRPAAAQDVGQVDPRNAPAKADPPGFFMGRPIADVMSWEGADWLFRETRIEEEQPEAMLAALKIPKGATVADVGTGAGYHSIRLARRVGPKGMVYATDVQPEMLRMLRENARAARLTNIKPVRCSQNDPGLPKEAIDLILMVDVYHECSDPVATLKGLRAALKPRGRLVLVEFRGEDPEVPIKPEHKMTLAQVRREIEPQGFTFTESLEFLPWQHVIIFEKPANPGANDDPTRKPDAKASQADRKQDHSARSYASREARSAVVRSLPSIPTRGVSEDLSHQAARTCGEPR